ncbi:hypothetical protein, partial [Streptomyces montanisoli]
MTIAPAEAEDVSAGQAEPAGPPAEAAAELSRTLAALTADLPDADPRRVAAAALRGASARAA